MDGKFLKTIKISTLYMVMLSGIAAVIGSGGGGGGDASWLFPLWVETDVVVADIDDDGLNDVVTLAGLSLSMSYDEGHVDVYHQTTRGSFTASTHVVGQYPWHLSVSDIDGDGLSDLLVTDVDLNNLWLLQHDTGSSGQFLAPQELVSGLNAYNAAVADFNNDAALDIALPDNRSGIKRVVMLYQDPLQPGKFLPPEDLVLPGTSSEVAAGDLNKDGLADLLVWLYLDPTGYVPNGVLAISFQQPDGSMGDFVTLAPQTGLNVDHLAIADYNGDGANDIFIFFTPFSSDYTAKLTVILQETEPGKFAAAPVDTPLAGIKGIDDAAAADLNDDGRPDFAVVGFFPEGSPSVVYSRLNLFLQSGNGAFSLADIYHMPIAVSRVTAGDIDGDSLNDLIVLGGRNEVLVMIQSHSAAGTFNPPKTL